MRASELAKMFHLEETYWWFVARRRVVRELLARRLAGPAGRDASSRTGRRLRILDVGCGTGAALKVFAGFGEVTGVDSSREALRYCRRRSHSRLVQARAQALPFANETADVVTALDLLEHVPDDAAAAGEFARVLRAGGVLVTTVPALPWLWSEHDRALDHLRRYQAMRLRRVLEAAGFRIERLSPLITTLLLPIAALRLLQRLLPHGRSRPETAFIVPPAPINRLLTALLWLENRWALRWNLPAGVSLLAVARRD